jgi:hypothetical protein
VRVRDIQRVEQALNIRGERCAIYRRYGDLRLAVAPKIQRDGAVIITQVRELFAPHCPVGTDAVKKYHGGAAHANRIVRDT